MENKHVIFKIKINLDLQGFTLCFEVSRRHPHLVRGIWNSTEW